MLKKDFLPVMSLSCAVFALCFFWCFYISIPFGLASILMAIVSFFGRNVTAKKYSVRAVCILTVLMFVTGILLAIPTTSAMWTALLETMFVYLF